MSNILGQRIQGGMTGNLPRGDGRTGEMLLTYSPLTSGGNKRGRITPLVCRPGASGYSDIIISPDKPPIPSPGVRSLPSPKGSRGKDFPLPLKVKNRKGFKGWEERDLEKDWVRVIKRNGRWDWFVTFTFSDDISEKYAHKLFQRWLGRLKSSLIQRKMGKKAGLRWIVSTEYTHSRLIHLHALLRADGLHCCSRQRWSERWKQLSRVCGRVRIDPARNRAASYLCKYVSKGGVIGYGGGFRIAG